VTFGARLLFPASDYLRHEWAPDQPDPTGMWGCSPHASSTGCRAVTFSNSVLISAGSRAV